MKKHIAITIVFVFLLCACGSNMAESNGQTQPNNASASLTWQEQYDLGIRYLSEGNYEEAIIAFTAAIEIAPKQAPAFVGRGDAYAALAEHELDVSTALTLWKKIVADYEHAFELGDTQVEKKLEESREILRHFQAKKDAQPLLEALYARFEDADVEGAKALMRQADYQELSASALNNPYYYDHGDGFGLAVYPNNFYYCGQWENGLRNGHGLWICAVFEVDSDSESYTYEGAWANDRPNGEGRIVRNRYTDQIQVEPGTTTSVKTEITGTFVDGLYHGTIYEVWSMNDGGIHVWSPITAVDGVYQAIEESDGRKVVAYDQGNSRTTLSDNGSVHIILGFGNES